MIPKIFISYTREDRLIAAQLVDLLCTKYGHDNVWYDEDLRTGEDWWNEILERVEWCDVFLFLLSTDSLKSIFCVSEYQEARRLNRPVFGIKIRPNLGAVGEVAEGITATQYCDFSRGFDPKELTKLYNAIELKAAQPKRSPNSEQRTPFPRGNALKGNFFERALKLSRNAQIILGPIAALFAVIAGAFGLIDRFAALTPVPPATAIIAAPTLEPTINVDSTIYAVQTARRSETLAALPTDTPSPTIDFQATVNMGLTATEQALNAGATETARSWTSTSTPTTMPTATRTPMSPLGSSLANSVRTNSQWTRVTRDFDGVTMVQVPAGCFTIGANPQQDDERNGNQICFDAPFWIDQTEVTQAQFFRFGGVKANANRFSGDQRPVENITWFEARDFCARRGARLPTEAEWEYAARGPDGLVYPWGNEWVAANAVHSGNSNNQTANVGGRPAGASWVGALDMAGNVWEWTSSLYQPYPYAAEDGREADTGTRTNVLRVLRGGSQDINVDLRAGFRGWFFPDLMYDFGGFRCARSYAPL